MQFVNSKHFADPSVDGATRFENCGRGFAKRKQSDADLAGNGLLRIVIIDIVINTLLGRVTRHPAGMHCPSRDDASVSSFVFALDALA